MKIFFLDRSFPLRYFTDLKQLESFKKIDSEINVSFSKNEVFVFQLLLLTEAETEKISVECIENIAGDSPEKHLYCLNTEGNDKWGNSFKKEIIINKNSIQPLYFYISAEDISGDEFQGEIFIKGEACRKLTLNCSLTNEKVENHGYNDLTRLSRIKWLNSTAFADNNAVPPYTKVLLGNMKIGIIGRDIHLTESGLPTQADSYFDEGIYLCGDIQQQLFNAPMSFNVEGEHISYQALNAKNIGDNAEISCRGESEKLFVETNAKVFYEGSAQYVISLTAKEDCAFSDISLSASFKEGASQYNSGFGKSGGAYSDIDYKWNDDHQDCVFIGGVNCGARIKLKDSDYLRPLVNIYYRSQPRIIPRETWDNHDKGRVIVERQKDNSVKFLACTGEYSMKKGEKRDFCFEIHFTPFRPIDYKKHYSIRYRHNNELQSWKKELEIAKKYNFNYIIIHHGNYLNPFINYPFLETEEMKKFAEAAHKEGIGVKYYYTSREHSNQMAEVFVYKALGDEIVFRKPGKGQVWVEGKSKWLPEYFGKDYTPAWSVKIAKGRYKGWVDEAFIVHPDSRLDNYYIEGLDWLVKNAGLDGIYIDDTALDRTTMERARKVLNQNNGLIDMHMWNHEEDRAGNASCSDIYLEIYPFIDSLWIGEGFPYNSLSPEKMMLQVSGIPYGLMSEMLEGGGNPYYGMLYSMNNRHGWDCYNSQRIYKLWDDFGIEDSEMRGYWHSKNPIVSDNKLILITVYLKKDSALVAVYNTADCDEAVNITVNDALLGFSAVKAECPAISGLQRKKKLSLEKPLSVKAKSGIIFTLDA